MSRDERPASTEPAEARAHRQVRKTAVVVPIMLAIAGLHFVTGPRYRGPFPEFVNGYLIDLVLPFGLYLLLCPSDAKLPWLRPWWVKAVPVFTIGVTVELLQWRGVPIFGRTYDPLDLVMYAAGVAMAVVADKLVFPRVFRFWASA